MKEEINMSVRSFAMYPETYEKLVELKQERDTTWDEVFRHLLKERVDEGDRQRNV